MDLYRHRHNVTQGIYVTFVKSLKGTWLLASIASERYRYLF